MLARRASFLPVLFAIACSAAPHPPTATGTDRKVAVYGDSFTSGWGTTPGGWSTWLPGSWTVFNGGVNDERGVPALNSDGSFQQTGTRRPTSDPDLSTLAAGWDVVVLFWARTT